MTPAALQVFAGARARVHLRERGLRPEDVAVVPAAAGGAKGLVLLPLDRYLFGTWLARAPQVVHLLGASIGAWRMACACRSDAAAALSELADDYIGQRYRHLPDRRPSPSHVSEVFRTKLHERLGARAAEVLAHPRRRLHVFTSRGRGLLAREGRVRTPLGYLGAFVANAGHRRALGGWLERVVFSDPRDPLPLPLADYRSRQVALDAGNLVPALLASCSIPFWLEAVHDVPGGPRGAYWDGGITDYHLHLDYAALGPGRLALYPHFQPQVVPGWLDKPWRRRHRATGKLDNLVVIAPHPDWVRTLPNARLPDRNDFLRYGEDGEARVRAWRRAHAESERLADEFARWVDRGPADVQPLA